MSLEKEPAGAFNKAQRLIECGLDIDELRVLQALRQLNSISAVFSSMPVAGNPARAAFTAACAGQLT
jgi:hypothetical protein